MTNLIETPTFAELVALLSDPDITVGLAGPPGVGKTSLAFAIGKRLKKKYVGKVQFHSELSPNEIMGYPMPGAESQWFAGPGDLAYSKGGLLIMDEIDKASGPCKTYLLGLLDKGPGGTISYPGRTFVQQKGYQVIATMNENPRDGVLPEAVLDRFDAWVFLFKPYDKLLQLLEPGLRELCVKMYDAATDPMMGPTFTFRMFLAFQKLREYLPIDKALLSACYGDQEQARSLLEVFSLQDDNEYDEDDEDESDEDPEEEGDDEEEEDDE